MSEGIKSNSLDPDEGNSKRCSACKLPIFATPFIISDEGAMLHDQCVHLPEELRACYFHPEKPLLLRDNDQQSSKTCSECSEECGTKLYSCPDSDCSLVLDVACAMPVKILHRSHLKHRVIAIRGCDKSCLGTCGVCGGKHQHGASEESRPLYICVLCGFWIHPECAALPNVIQHEKHVHPLVLYYEVSAALSGAALGREYDVGSFTLAINRVGADLGKQYDLDSFLGKLEEHNRGMSSFCSKCDICGADDAGIYSCIKCRGYFIHIRCAGAAATSESGHQSFTVLGRDMQFPDLIRLPFSNEHLSHLEHTLKNATGGAFKSGCDRQEFFERENIKDEYADGDKDVGSELVCDACLKVINNPPFYIGKESTCPNYLFHHSCSNLPDVISSHPAHTDRHYHSLFITISPHLTGGICSHCRCPVGRSFYSCWWCQDKLFNLDVSCARMPAVVTHDEHGSTHFLHLTQSSHGRSCDCCGRSLGELGYECWTCPNFALHTWCAMLPKTVTHKFDPHPLRLITSGVGVAEICEICENNMDDKVWYYGCKECDQWFHIDCLPCLDLNHKINTITDYFSREPIPIFYSDVDFSKIRRQFFDHKMDIPTRLIRGLTLQGHGKDYCTHVADEYDIVASH